MKSKEQAAYSRAHAAYKDVEARTSAHEKTFLSAHPAAVDQRGRTASRLYQVHDDDLFEALEAEYQEDPKTTALAADYRKTRVAFVKAERALIAWALSIVPADVRDTLAPAADTDPATRKRIIDLAMQLDVSTIFPKA